MPITTFLLLGLGAFLLAVLITPWVGILAKRFGAIQESPAEVLKKIQEQRERGLSDQEYEAKLQAARRRPDKPAIVLWGGIGYIVPFVLISAFALLSSRTISIPQADIGIYVVWFVIIGILFVIGLLDDVFELSGRVQFIFHVLAAFLFVLSPIDVNGFNNPITGGYIDTSLWTYSFGSLPWMIRVALPGDLFLLLWILPLIMGLKVQAGIDGLMEGNVAFGMLAIFFVCYRFGLWTPAMFAIVLAGAVFGFLLYNFYPHKIISGSAGKSAIGFIVAGIAIIGGSKLGATLIVFAIPLFDLLWVYLRRILYYKPKSFSQLFSISDRFHFHHRLLHLGWSERAIALAVYGLVIIFGLIAYFTPYAYKTYALGGVWLFVSSMIIYTTRRSHE